MYKSTQQFTKLYSLSKTLRFELEPIGKTSYFIEKKGIISEDKLRSENYQKMKNTIDGFHKYFIELAMENVHLTHLETFQKLYYASPEEKKNENFKKQFEEIQKKLRKEIADGFKTGKAKEIFSKINKKELITELLEDWVQKQPNKQYYFDPSFKTFTTYFTGFNENRQNMYTDKVQSTAIAYRMIHENLPKFLDNIKIFEQIKGIPELYEKSKTLFKNIEEYLNIKTIDEAFELPYFNEILTQKQIDIYNLIIVGRIAEEGKPKIQGLNEYINLYNQLQKEKNKRVPKLKVLYKQILSDREKTSFTIDKFENSQEVTEAINGFYHHNIISYKPADKPEPENILETLEELLSSLKEYSLDKIYLRNDNQLTQISQKIFGNFSVFLDALSYYYDKVIEPNFENDYQKANEKKKEKLDAEKNKYLKQDYFSIAHLQYALDNYVLVIDDSVEWKEKYSTSCIADYFKTHYKTNKKEDSSKEFSFTADIQSKYSCIKGLLENYPMDKKLHQDKQSIDNIKLFLDSIIELLHFVKPLILATDSTLEKDQNFYGQLEPWFESLKEVIRLYNKVRNFATQKAYSTEKFKLNFDNSTLLDGWDINKETDNLGILFIKGHDYYLGIMAKKHNRIFKSIPAPNTDRTYQKVNYKLLPGPSKMLPKVFFSKSNIEYYRPSEEILRIRNHSTHTKNGKPQDGFEKKDFNLEDCHAMIEFFKQSIEKHPEWNNFGFKFSNTKSYKSIDEFYQEVENQGYYLNFTEVDEDYVHQLIDDGKLYLFRIKNKDFSTHSKGKPNLHTLYWKALFSPENLKDVVYKLNGQAEIFYRKSSIKPENKIIHKANQTIDNKNPLAKKKQSIFTYDIIKDKRFTVDKYQFHVPITLNFKSKGSDNINYEVLDYLKQNNKDVNIIGLDRGERHLIYLTLINQKGQIIHQESLNTIKSDNFEIETPYHELLVQKENERDEARKSWGTIENIKELKEGYLSQVVHKIAKMMVEHNAIVVMEDLNMGFKRGRFKVERQVYQKLEKMLINKLNYLTFKDFHKNEPGGLFHALQLTSKFESFKKMGKQSGFLFYVPASYTSKIDPETGFVNLFQTKYENIEKAKSFFQKFKSIRYNKEQHYFEFEFDYNDFTTKAEGTKNKWTICAYGERILTFRNTAKNNQWDNQTVMLTEQFEDLFGKYNIVYGDGKDLKEKICEQNDKDFFKTILNLFKLTLQMRNSITGTDEDFLISPVRNTRGEFFDSRKTDHFLPQNADANGAYHIAKKGLWWIKQIKEFNDNDWKKLNLDKTNKGWLKFVQE